MKKDTKRRVPAGKIPAALAASPAKNTAVMIVDMLGEEVIVTKRG